MTFNSIEGLIMKKTFLAVILGTVLVGCCPTPENTNTNSKPTEAKEADTDIRIMQARRYVADYDERMEKANTLIERCRGNSTNVDVVRQCTTNAYSTVGFDYGAYSCFSCVEIRPNIVEEYKKMKDRSLLPLTTEVQ